MDFNQCPCSGKSLPKLIRPAVMAVLAQETLHGYVVVQRLADFGMFEGQVPDPSGVYKTLKAMEDEGLVRSFWELADAGPAKRCYRLTDVGLDCLGRWEETLGAYQSQLIELVGVLRQRRLEADRLRTRIR